MRLVSAFKTELELRGLGVKRGTGAPGGSRTDLGKWEIALQMSVRCGKWQVLPPDSTDDHAGIPSPGILYGRDFAKYYDIF